MPVCTRSVSGGGRRWTTADGFVVPARKRPNFTVLTDTHVLGVRISQGCAVGVEVARGGAGEFLSAEREVVLSAGALNTPQLLMLSGIGPADHLAEHQIATIVDSLHVGAHLMDHPLYTMNFETSAKGTLDDAQSPRQMLDYFVRGPAHLPFGTVRQLVSGANHHLGGADELVSCGRKSHPAGIPAARV